MKITNSSVAMTSSHSESRYTHTESMTMKAAASDNLAGAILTLSGEAEGKTTLEGMKQYKRQKEEEAAQKKKENQEKAAKVMAENLRKQAKAEKASPGGEIEMSDEYKLKLEMIKKMFAMLRQGKALNSAELKLLDGKRVLDVRSSGFAKQEFKVSFGAAAAVSFGTSSSGTLWHKVTAVSGFTSETESTAFAATGRVQTADGRDIDFNIEVGMSRAFVSKFDSLTTESYVLTDPLMINLDTNIGTVTDQKFFFDLDSDGEKEEISFAGNGSGFLALDKNGDGKINDGSELFGTASGDGFKDLAAYDEDGNGWIDENDDIFNSLKVWTKDEDGNDRLMDLKQADVGAIYLGNVDTAFSLKDSENRTNGMLQRTGVYLKESTGAAGTLNHVDLAV